MHVDQSASHPLQGSAPARLVWRDHEQLDDTTRAGFLGTGAFFELTETTVLGVPMPVFAQRAASLADVVANAANHGARAALIASGSTLTFSDLPGAVDATRARLAGLGVAPGDRVVVCGRTSTEHCLVSLAVMGHGAILTPLNPSGTVDEIAHAVGLVEPALVVADSEIAAPCARAAGDVPVTTFDELFAGPEPAACEPTEIDEDSPCAIIFTSGTTGRPKGATLSHRNIVHFCLSTSLATLVQRLTTATDDDNGAGVAVQALPTVMASSPLFHVSGLLGQLVNGVMWGLTLVIPPPGRWDETTHLELSERHRVTTWSLVPTQLWRVLEHPELDRYDLSSLTTIGGGGATFPPELLRVLAERLPHTTPGMRVGYGMTEASGTLTMLQPPVRAHEIGSVGSALPGTEVEVRGPDGRPLPQGEIGQIWGRSGGVFLGYWDDDAATTAVLDADRWYATGDYGRIDGGVLFVESRLRELIIRGGENIYPVEIENRLVEHPAIADAAVVGVADRVLGQQVKAVVVARPGAVVDADGVRSWVAATLARYKVPSQVEIVDQLPRNALGKVLKNLLVKA